MLIRFCRGEGCVRVPILQMQLHGTFSRIPKGYSSGEPQGWMHSPCCSLLALFNLLLRATERKNSISNPSLDNSRSLRWMSVSMSEWKPTCRAVKHHLFKLRWFSPSLGLLSIDTVLKDREFCPWRAVLPATSWKSSPGAKHEILSAKMPECLLSFRAFSQARCSCGI